MTRIQSRKGFTLIEILIVVIILGILAAIVIPQFTNASQDARKNSLTSQLQTIRSQIELYKLQHNDKLPNVVHATGANWNLLTQKTTQLGAVSATGSFGPYLQADPVNPLNNQKGVQTGTGAAAPSGATTGWVYDYGTAGEGTGKFWATGTVTTMYFDEGTGLDAATLN